MPPSPLPPKIHTYHCLCSTLLLATTHTLSLLPRRSTTTNPTTGSLDSVIILPLPPPPSPQSHSPAEEEEDGDNGGREESREEGEEEEGGGEGKELPREGYTTLLSLVPSKTPTLIRREDGFGFEKRLLWRCMRCRVVVGYELVSQPALALGDRMDGEGSGTGKGKGKERGKEKGKEEEYKGRVMYLLPGGVMSTEFMVGLGKEGARNIEEDVDVGELGVSVFD